MKRSAAIDDTNLNLLRTDGWVDISPETSWVMPSHSLLDSKTNSLDALATLRPVDIFLSIFDMEVVELIVMQCSAMPITSIHVYGCFAMRCILQGRGKPQDATIRKDVFSTEYTKVRSELIEKFDLPNSRHRPILPGAVSFRNIMNNIQITPQLAMGLLSERMMAMVAPTSYISMDHKLKKYFGNCPIIRCAPDMKTKKEHSITLVSYKLESTHLPVVVGFYPKFTLAQDGKDRVLSEVWMWLAYLLKKCEVSPIICSDAYYVSESVPYLCDELGLKWMGVAKLKTLPRLDSLARKRTAAKVGHVVAYNPKLGLMYSCYSAEGARRKKVRTISNAFTPYGLITERTLQEQLNNIYTSWFLSSQNFFRILSLNWWHYHRRSWAKHLDTFFFHSILLNCYHLWRSVADVSGRQSTSFPAFCLVLGEQLLRHIAEK